MHGLAPRLLNMLVIATTLKSAKQQQTIMAMDMELEKDEEDEETVASVAIIVARTALLILKH